MRDVLNILRGEGLVETRTGEGFFRPHITAPDLEDLYAWVDQVLAAAIRQWPKTANAGAAGRGPAQPAEATAELFFAIAARAGNLEYERAIASANDRLHAARAIEADVLDAVGDELAAIVDGTLANDARTVTRLLAAYHRRRRRLASDIVRAIYRA